ncbi:MAG TPA: DinB family protein [Thermodesulfobacteriota bacterium]
MLLERYQRIFGAFSRAARQVPDDRLVTWKSPERDRDLRQFLFHVYDRPDLMLQGLETGVYRYEDVLKAYDRAEAYETTSALVDRGDELMAGVYAFLRTATPERLAQPIDSYQGVLAIGELLTLALGHAAHHLRQLYHYFGILGITPDRPLVDRDFEGIAMPAKLF